MKTFEDIKNNIKLHYTKSEFKNLYEVELNWDSNDGDYISSKNTFSKEEFEENILLHLILSFVSKYEGTLFGNQWNDSIYGHHINDNKDFPLITDFLNDYDLVSYSDWGMCHSVSGIDITYFDKNGERFYVSLPDFDTLFKTKEEAIDIVNNELEKYFNKID